MTTPTIQTPHTLAEPVREVVHGMEINDPYRWLEDQNSPLTQNWIEEQTCYARSYLDNVPGRDKVRQRIREFLAVETYDTLQRSGGRYLFRKRLPDQDQPCIYLRRGINGKDQLLIDPSARGTGKYTAVMPLRLSPDGRLLLYQVKEGGEITGTFEILDIESRRTLPDVLPRGYLRGFVFAPDSKSFYYSHESFTAERPFYRASYHHFLGTPFSKDREIFCAGEDQRLRLCLISDPDRLGFVVYRFLKEVHTELYLMPFTSTRIDLLLSTAGYRFGPLLVQGRILAITNRMAPNYKIVEVRPREEGPDLIDVVHERDVPIRQFAITRRRILVSYLRQTKIEVLKFNFRGTQAGALPAFADESVRIIGSSTEHDDLLLETQSFAQPTAIYRYSPKTGRCSLWAKTGIGLDPAKYGQTQLWFRSKDGTPIPIFLMGRRDVLEKGSHPTIMTSYGGYGIPVTPKFSVFVAFLAEQGCLFALPNIRGGSEFGAEWHNAAKRLNRQNAYDDFLSAAEWLINTGRTAPNRLAIFGGSNSGLLVGAALTQRPDLFRAVVCMVPILDMVRYHLFDNAHLWKEEFGSSEDPNDFAALIKYSPYHNVRDGTAYPATMIVSGDADGNCNPLHARKMTARLQAANASERPIFLDYTKFRGHSPVLPLSHRIEALTDRVAFLCDQLQLHI